ncbi:hypothetical protein [Clostridium sp. AM46-21]|nr:hypothetical protein [Clostridium sp. AM46-21]
MNKHDLTSYIDTLSACRLFTGIDEQDLPAMLHVWTETIFM